MRMGKILAVIAFSALFLLMLSALVVTTAPEATPDLAPLSASQLNAQFMPALLPVPDISSHADMRQPVVRFATLIFFATAALALPLLRICDANGRILNARRYEDSYYQVFRQEVAGG